METRTCEGVVFSANESARFKIAGIDFVITFKEPCRAHAKDDHIHIVALEKAVVGGLEWTDQIELFSVAGEPGTTLSYVARGDTTGMMEKEIGYINCSHDPQVPSARAFNGGTRTVPVERAFTLILEQNSKPVPYDVHAD